MNFVLLDAKTLGNSNLDGIKKLGNLTTYDTTDKKDVIKRAKDAEVILTNKVVLDAATLGKLPKLKLICVTATGMNNIDLEAAKKLKIEVKNVANYSTNAVAQHTLMFALAMLGKLRYYGKYTRSGKWSKSDIFTHIYGKQEIYELDGKNWGIIGFGNIGQRVAQIAKVFGANVSYYSTSGKNSVKGFERAKTLESLLKNSDIISIHAPLNKDTQNLIAAKELKMLKKDAILINVGRGGIVNESDVAKALKGGGFYFACDVLATEPMEKNHPLLDKKLKNLIITPHIAWAYKESRARLIAGIESNIKDFLAKKRA